MGLGHSELTRTEVWSETQRVTRGGASVWLRADSDSDSLGLAECEAERRGGRAVGGGEWGQVAGGRVWRTARSGANRGARLGWRLGLAVGGRLCGRGGWFAARVGSATGGTRAWGPVRVGHASGRTRCFGSDASLPLRWKTCLGVKREGAVSESLLAW